MDDRELYVAHVRAQAQRNSESWRGTSWFRLVMLVVLVVIFILRNLFGANTLDLICIAALTTVVAFGHGHLIFPHFGTQVVKTHPFDSTLSPTPPSRARKQRGDPCVAQPPNQAKTLSHTLAVTRHLMAGGMSAAK